MVQQALSPASDKPADTPAEQPQPAPAQPAPAQPAPTPDFEPQTVAYEQEEVSRTETGLLDVHVRQTPIATVLEMLSYEARANIVTSTSVKGDISANLYAVTLEEALDAILTPNNFRFMIVGKTVFVGTAEEIASLRPPPITKVFSLQYVRPAEAAAAVKSVLSQDTEVVESGGGEANEEEQLPSAASDYLVITDYPDRIAAAEEVLAQIDQRPRQVLIEATVLRATLNEDNQFGVDFTMLGGVDFQDVGSTSDASTNLTTGQTPANDLQSTTFNINTDFAGNITGGGFTFGLIKDSLAGFVRALEDVTDVVVVANPKIVALNKQEAHVIVGRRDGYITTTVTETAAVQQVEFLETGTQIKFTPLVNNNGSVRLVVHPKDSNGGLTAANLPFEETTEAQADLLVEDGHTVLIGGLFRERTVSSKSQLPVLGDIPGAGLLFGSKSDQTIREEVIILLTVHIIKDTAQEKQAFRELVEDVERMRVGNRRGLLATGRERLAQAHFHEALRMLEQGHRNRAVLNLRLTLHNQPKHIPAIKLLERLLGERQWDEEGTRMHSFIWRLLAASGQDETPADAGVFGRPRYSPPKSDHTVSPPVETQEEEPS